MGAIIGIDLGTTNSCMAVVQNGKPVVIPNMLGQRLTPSVVRLDREGQAVVGEQALRYRSSDPRNTITGIKRLIGRRYNEVADIVSSLPYQVTLGPNNLAVVRSHGRSYTSQMVSAMILKFLKISAEKHLGQEVTQAVITIPAYFGERQRHATKEAGEIAGLEVLRILNEPTAAAFAYGAGEKKDETLAVLDLGGGTFDVSVVQVGEGVAEVRAIAGDGFLGGDDFDERIVEWIIQQLWSEAGVQLPEDPAGMEEIRTAATRAKCELSERHEVEIDISHLPTVSGERANFRPVLTRTKFEEICEELFERLADPCRHALEDSGLKMETGGRLTCFGDVLNRVILVGGASRMPRVAETAKLTFGMEPRRSINPDEAIALGAGIQAGVLGGEVKDILLLDVTSASLSVETVDGKCVLLLSRNTHIPTRKTEVFSTSEDNQTSVEAHIVQGESLLAIDNRTLGRLVLDGVSPAPQGIPQIEVTLDIDANGILRVGVKDLGTGKEEKQTIRPSTGLTKEDLWELRLSLPSIGTT
jgi:molecular chaperone DnaK